MFQPVLADRFASLNGVSYQIKYSDRFIAKDDPSNDEAHIHNCYEIYLNITGDVSFLVNDKLYSIHSGDAVLTRPGEVHHCIYRSSCVHAHFCLWFDADADTPVAVALMNGARNLFASPYDTGDERALVDLFAALRNANEAGDDLVSSTSFLNIIRLCRILTE